MQIHWWTNSWIVLLPALITLFISYTFRRINTALLVGIVTACALIVEPQYYTTPTLALSKIWQTTQLDHVLTWSGSFNRLYMFLFLFILGIIISLITATGGINAYARIVSSRLKTAREVQTASLFLSLILFIDDYLSNLTAGSVMRPLSDKFRIARVKLAFLINSMAAPITILSPISSWVAEITTQLSNAGVSNTITPTTLILANPFSLYLQLIPYIAYSFILVASVIFIVQRGISFGTMRIHEEIAQTTGNLVGGKPLPVAASLTNPSPENSIIDFIVPIVTLVVCVIGGLLYTGNASLFGGTRSLIEAFQNGDIFSTLFFSGFCSLSISLCLALLRNKIALHHLFPVIKDGINLMYPSIFMLCLAWTLSSLLTNELQTGQYLAHLLSEKIPLSLLPVVFFIVSCITTIAIGSSWGAIALMTAIAIPMTITFVHVATPASLEAIPSIFPILGAILSGAIAGNTVSPLADATIMASTSTQCYHADHIRTQTQYCIAPFIATACTFILFGFTNLAQSLWGTLFVVGIGIIISWTLLSFIQYYDHRKTKKTD